MTAHLTHRIPKIPSVASPGASQALDALGRRWDGSWPPVGGRFGLHFQNKSGGPRLLHPCEITGHFLPPLPRSHQPLLGCVWEPSSLCGETGVRKETFFQAGRDRKVSLFAKFLPSHLLFPINSEEKKKKKKPYGPAPRSSHHNSHGHLSTSQ